MLYGFCIFTLLFDCGVVLLSKTHGNCIIHTLFDSFHLLKPQNTGILQDFLGLDNGIFLPFVRKKHQS